MYRALGGSGAALDAALIYSTFIFSGALAVWLVNAFGSVLRGSGQMMVPALVIVGGEVIHPILAPTLIFGFQLGIAGAGFSLVTSYMLRASALAAFAFSKRSTVRPVLVPISTHQTWDILKVGLPGAINTVLTNVNVAAITGIVGTFGTAALAGYGLGARLEYLQIPLVFGFGTALVTLVGINVGAGQIDRARRIAWLGAGLAAALTGSIGLLAAIWPNVWLGAFTDAPQVREIGELYLRIVGPTYGFFGLGLALYFAAQGTGQLLWSVLAGVLRLVIALAAGWFAINIVNGGLPAVFAGIATSFVVFGAAQSVAITRALRQCQLRFKLQ
jgi:Na+-driven multidrug efflux pump